MTPDNRNLKNIFLVGFMGAGKTTVGRVLADRLGYRYCDADKTVETQSGKTITDIFSEHGEEHFRDLESRTLEALSHKEKQVIATGGGVVMRDTNRETMKRGGVTVYLRAPADVIWQRVRHSSARPLLQVDDPLGTIRELLEKRAPYYEKADIIVDTENLSVEDVADQIIEKLGIKPD